MKGRRFVWLAWPASIAILSAIMGASIWSIPPSDRFTAYLLIVLVPFLAALGAWGEATRRRWWVRWMLLCTLIAVPFGGAAVVDYSIGPSRTVAQAVIAHSPELGRFIRPEHLLPEAGAGVGYADDDVPVLVTDSSGMPVAYRFIDVHSLSQAILRRGGDPAVISCALRLDELHQLVCRKAVAHAIGFALVAILVLWPALLVRKSTRPRIRDDFEQRA